MFCDVCGNRIADNSQICIQWLFNGSHRYQFKIVHGEQSQISSNRRCYYDPKKALEQGVTIEEVFPTDFPIEDTLARLLALIKQGNCNAYEVAEIIHRLIDCNYEEARGFIDEAISNGVIEPVPIPEYYPQVDIQAVLEYARREYPDRFGSAAGETYDEN